MQTLMPWIAVAVTIVAGWALIKRYQTHMVLLFAGLVLLLCAAGLTDASFLPKGVKPSGFFLFDIFNTLKSIATKQSAGIGFLIMTAGGFAAYMDRIGAARALVDIAVKPLSMLKAPYLVLVGGYLVGQILVMVIPSAAGLAMLLLVALFPILKAVGTSAASAAGIVALIICAEFFATGLKVSGLIDALINSAQGIGAGMGVMTVILTAIVSAVTFLTGSGVGAYSSFASLAPDVAAGLGGSVAALVTPMQFASGMLRAMNPVAGVIIAVAGAASISPMAVVRRTWIPMIAGMFTTIIANMIFFG